MGISSLLEAVANAIRIIFILDFAVKLALAPDKTDYLRVDWLMVIAPAVPALRVIRIFRVVRVFGAARIPAG